MRTHKYLILALSLIMISGCSKSIIKKFDVTDLNKKSKIVQVEIPVEQDISVLLPSPESAKECVCDYHERLTQFTEDREQLKVISKEVIPYSIMSLNAYDNELQLKLPNWERVSRMVSKHGFSSDIYVSSNGNEIVIAFRGTDDAKDWLYANLDTDPKGQYNDADKVYKKVAKDYRGKRIITTGHSLGGGLAMHVSILNPDVDAYVFDPSPRVFSDDRYDMYQNKIVILYETGEILEAIRPLFISLKKIKPIKYRYNFLDGDPVMEHSIEAFSRCMYATTVLTENEYGQVCNSKTLSFLL